MTPEVRAGAVADPAGRDFSYEYKPAVMSAAHQFRLADDALEWQVGRRTGRLPYASIRRVRLSFRPVSLQPHRFLAEIWPASGPRLQIASTTWRSLVEQGRLDGEYSAFVTELHRRLMSAGTRVSFEAGTTAWVYWTGLVFLVAILLGLAALVVRGLQANAIAGAAFVALFLVAFLWKTSGYVRRNRPGTYAPDALPPAVMP